MKLEGFIGPTYALNHPSAASQRLVNLYPEVHEAGPRKGNVARFVGTPGLRKRATLGDGPTRAMHTASTGQVFVVSGANVYEVFSSWTASVRPGSLATSSGPVTIASDDTRLVIGDGTPQAYYCPLAAGSAVAVMADADCLGGHVTWQDGYFLHTIPNTGRFQISGLNALTYDALDVATAEGRPDLLRMILSINRQVFLFGDATTEIWWNTGAATFPFARNAGAFIETGTVAAGSCVRARGGVAWVGSDERGRGTVWHASGLIPQRISTHAVEQALAGYSRLSEARAFAYQQQGHEFFQLSVPDGGTWCYDFSTNLWHERMYLSSTGEQPHRAHVGTAAFGEVLVGDRADGRIYSYDLSYYSDDGDPIRRVRQSPHISQDEKRIRYNHFELQAQMGVGLQSGQGSAPVAWLSWSDDGGNTWSNERSTSLGAVGQYANRARWTRLGMARDRVFRVAMSDPIPVTWLGADIGAVQLGK